MERKVGEIFTYRDKTYQVVKGNRCSYCDIGNMCIALLVHAPLQQDLIKLM